MTYPVTIFTTGTLARWPTPGRSGWLALRYQMRDGEMLPVMQVIPLRATRSEAEADARAWRLHIQQQHEDGRGHVRVVTAKQLDEMRHLAFQRSSDAFHAERAEINGSMTPQSFSEGECPTCHGVSKTQTKKKASAG